MADYKDNGSEKKGKVIYNIGIVKGIVRLAVEDVAGVAIQYRKRTVRTVSYTHLTLPTNSRV